jgi:predicted ATPase/DNA-binding CsgD family transcriptional regulator
MTRVAPGAAPAGMHGFTSALTSFVGRADAVAEVTKLVEEYRLVTVTGPGGVGKTRLAAEVARRVAGRVADGAWLTELASVSDPALVPMAVAAALGVPAVPGVPVMESLAAVVERQQLLLVLDNCEHLLAAVAELCAALLPAADDVRILVTSREAVGVDGEARYRLAPLSLAGPGDQAGPGTSEAVALFVERARRVDPHFTLSGETGEVVARLVERLDGLPLAIELAAARVEALSVADLLSRLDDSLQLLAGGRRLAADRHRSLAAAAGWSYELLTEQERQVFRRLAVFPGPFTLEAAEAVAAADATPAVLHLVDCSLLTPPRAGPDGRARYSMLETLRAYGAERLAAAGEEPDAAAALARFALDAAERAAAGLETGAGEVAAARWVDAEDATVHQVLAWAIAQDPPTALRLAMALAPWWSLRGRWSAGYEFLGAAAGHAAEGGEQWCAAQFWLGLLAAGFSHVVGLRHYTAVRDALAGQAASPLLSLAVTSLGGCLANLGHGDQAEPEIRRGLALARETGDPAAEAWALVWLAELARRAADLETSVAWCRQARRIDLASVPGWIARAVNETVTEALTAGGELAAARESCASGLAAARHAGAPYYEAVFGLLLARLDLLAGRLPEARAHLGGATEIAVGIGHNLPLLMVSLDLCGYLCAQAKRPAEAVTAWAAYAACEESSGMRGLSDERPREEALRNARQELGPEAARAAEERGAAMGWTAAAEYVALLMAKDAGQPPGSSAAPGLPRLSARERELVALVARGRTNAQIAGQLYISVRTVGSHLDRIREKTGCRRRADLTRFALRAGLV